MVVKSTKLRLNYGTHIQVCLKDFKISEDIIHPVVLLIKNASYKHYCLCFRMCGFCISLNSIKINTYKYIKYYCIISYILFHIRSIGQFGRTLSKRNPSDDKRQCAGYRCRRQRRRISVTYGTRMHMLRCRRHKSLLVVRPSRQRAGK